MLNLIYALSVKLVRRMRSQSADYIEARSSAAIRPDIELQPIVDVNVIFVLQTGCVQEEKDIGTSRLTSPTC